MLGLIGLVIVVFWLVVAFIGPLVAPYKGGALTSTEIFGSYSAAYPLGTDYLGRDMLSRILYGTRYTVGPRARGGGARELHRHVLRPARGGVGPLGR